MRISFLVPWCKEGPTLVDGVNAIRELLDRLPLAMRVRDGKGASQYVNLALWLLSKCFHS